MNSDEQKQLENQEKQQCFSDGAYTWCNLIYRRGHLIGTKSGKWWKFPTGRKRRLRKKNKNGTRQRSENAVTGVTNR